MSFERNINIMVLFYSDREFSSSLTLLSSELTVSGQYGEPNSDDFEGSVDISATLPSGDEYSTNGSLSYSYDGTLRNIEVGDKLHYGSLHIELETFFYLQYFFFFC